MYERPGTKQMWARSDANLPGSGQQLESWALQQIQEAQERGELDTNDPAALQSYLTTLGITDEKGGGRFLYRKFMGMHGPSPLAAIKGIGAGAGMSGHSMGRSALLSRYGSPSSSIGNTPSGWGGWSSWR